MSLRMTGLVAVGIMAGMGAAMAETPAANTGPEAKAPAAVAPAGALGASEALAKETEAACAASATNKPTPQMLVEKVAKACALVEKEGTKAFPKFKGKDSEFVFCGTHIFIIAMDGTTLVQPIKYKLEGTSAVGMKDSTGKRFFVEFIDLCKTKGAGWAAYTWPKPGEEKVSAAVSYVRKASCEGKGVVVGCGAYDLTLEEVQKAAAR